ncbi:MAG: DinB family protein [Bacteroidota bacterium]
MSAYQLIEDKIRYNQWANQRILDWLKPKSSHLLLEPVQSSFTSLNKVIHHIMEAETYYLSILEGTEGRYYEELPTEEIFQKLLAVDQRLLSWYIGQTSEVVDKIISLKRSPHEERYSVATLITHIVNHTTYHRGQIVGMRHQIGITEPPKTDYYWMFAEKLLTNDKLNEPTRPGKTAL